MNWMHAQSLSAQKAAQAKACAQGRHDPGLALRSRLDIPEGSAYNPDGPQRDNAFLDRRCRACNGPC